jgi:diguanylate cyclase (GGDEF)-like protein/hemerythrin-like metal-binding protein/PAS domain S-box-containing protein
MSSRFPIDEIFRWSDGFDTGLAEVDEQHHQLVGILNKLASYHTGDASDEELLEVFDELVDYTVYHFNTEDALMNEVGVSPEHAFVHRRVHKSFIDMAQAARQEAENAARDVTGHTLAFLTKWLIQHILSMDRQLSSEVATAQAEKGLPITVTPPPDGEKTTAVLLDALDSLYVRLGHNTEQLQRTNRQLEQEVTKSKQAEQLLRIAATAFEAQEGIVITDVDGTVLRVNQAFTRITGYEAADVIGQTPKILNSGRQDLGFYQHMWTTIQSAGTWQGEIWNRRKSGEVYPEWLSITAVKNEDGVTTHYVGAFSDITTRKAAEDEVRQLAFYDSLTGLPNRKLMHDRLNQAIASSTRHNCHGALMLIDLDNFKSINDTLGHAAGDALLIEASRRLLASVRMVDTVARLGGDEFVVIIGELNAGDEAASQARLVAEKILAALEQPFTLESRLENGQVSLSVHHCPASVGITLFRDASEDADELLKQADTAMYQAKQGGRNTLRFYDPEMHEAVKLRASLEADLRKAIVEEQFSLYYQPQIQLESGAVVGAEALLRWHHPERGLVSPADFIPVAEESGLILPLGHWVVQQACIQLAAWAQDAVTSHLCLSVNVSAKQFSLPTFVEEVLALIDFYQVAPGRLQIELTESLLLDNAEDVVAKMQLLKERGVGFSLDDFGTGYSSLAYLKRLPLDELKIDQSFVRDILCDTNDAAIARTIIALADSLGLDIIAEGVEQHEQATFLADHGCGHCQGYLYSRPLPLAAFTDFLRRCSATVTAAP